MIKSLSQLKDEFLVAMFRRALSIKEVAGLLEDALEGRLNESATQAAESAVSDAIREFEQNFEVDADSVNGLDYAVEDALKNCTPCADDIKGIDDAVLNAIREQPEEVIEAIFDNPRAVVKLLGLLKQLEQEQQLTNAASPATN